MPKKAGGKKKGGGKKKKGPTLLTSEADLAPFGFKVRDIISTPMGLKGTVIGVKIIPGEERLALMVEFPGGRVSPLELKLQQPVLGYRKAPDAEHIWRDVCIIRDKMKLEAEERTAAMERQRLRMEALALESALTDKKNAKKAKKPKPAALDGEAPRPETAPV
mmetsp:Transcript_39205/g.65881  ORF Transcript_39205/g.65881 Transcript_39205/m.65881 type:complete len:163 (+) Transcript_39205:212-700(+)